MHKEELKYLIQREIFNTAYNSGIDINTDISGIIITHMSDTFDLPIKSVWGMAAIFNDDRFVFKFKYSGYTNNVVVTMYERKWRRNNGL